MTLWNLRKRPFVQPTFQSISTTLPFNELDLKKALLQANPTIFAPSLWKSFYFFFQDLFILTLLIYSRKFWVYNWFGYIIWMNITGFFMWSLFVIGHDCGHGTFSSNPFINFVVGHVSHAPLLVPFYGWKLSHYYHHLYSNDIDRDTVWYPLSETLYENCTSKFRVLRYSHLLLFLFPIYLLDDGPMSSGNHFNPRSKLFQTNTERILGGISTITVLLFLCSYLYFCGLFSFLINYLPCYFVFLFWLDIVTFLHHTHPEGIYYRKPSWTFLKGVLTTIDRSYGSIVDYFQHSINLHVAHHLFFNKIPHYNLKEATQILKPLLGSYYTYDKTPFWMAYIIAQRDCRHVSDDGTILTFTKN